MKNIIFILIFTFISISLSAQKIIGGHHPARMIGQLNNLSSAQTFVQERTIEEAPIDSTENFEDEDDYFDASAKATPLFYKNREVTDYAENEDKSKTLIFADGSSLTLSADGSSTKEVSADGLKIISKTLYGNKIITTIVENMVETTIVKEYIDGEVKTQTIVVNNNEETKENTKEAKALVIDE